MANESGTVGLATRKSATAALEAHVAVLKGTPLRRAISEALAAAPKLGGKERRFVAFATRELSRHLRFIEALSRARGWPSGKLQLPEDQALLRYALWRQAVCHETVEKIMTEVALPGPIRPRGIPDQVLKEVISASTAPDLPTDPIEREATLHSFPNWLARALSEVSPPGELGAVLEALNREPAMTFRARPVGTRDALVAAVRAQGLAVEPVAEHPDALRVSDESRAIFESRFMKEGRLQVMDLGSQLLAALCRAAPGQTVVDYCAGAGGKTLALADAVGPTGRVYAWDESKKRLAEGRRRVQELGLRHVSFPDAPRLDLAQVVLIDAPCSGTGTLGREPDQKWKLKEAQIVEFAATQAQILRQVASKVGPGTVLVYGTCSLLRAEDEAVVEAFLSSHADWRLEETLRVWPHRVPGGGFFGARLVKVC